jgi:CheY-like chemotaxis protein
VNLNATVLVADDDRDVLEALKLLLKSEGYTVETAMSPAGIVAAVTGNDFDVALIDMNYTRDTTSGSEGLDLIQHLQQLDATLPVVVDRLLTAELDHGVGGGENCLVLDGRGDDMHGPAVRARGERRTDQREVVRLGPAGGENDLARLDAERFGCLALALLKSGTCRPPETVRRRRIAPCRIEKG